MTVTSVLVLQKMIPKTYKHRNRVLKEILTVLAHNKFLEPVMDRFVFNDGTSKRLMSLTGTIWVSYHGKGYNIPVCLWLEESYPHSAPICYVKPTCDMMILTGRHVTSSGEILLPYLNEWRHSQCDLTSLVQVMSLVFGELPPVCIRPSNPAPQDPLLQRYTGMCSKEENSNVLCLKRGDGLPFQQDDETNC